MYVNIDLNELAAEITRKIRDEVSRIRVVDFGEVKNITKLDNGGWTAEVLLPGAENLTNPLNCLQNYVPNIGDWVMIIYPPQSEPVLVDCTPMRENMIMTPEDKFAMEGDVPDHDHDVRYYTKTLSDEKYAAAAHNHDGRYYTKDTSDKRYMPIDAHLNMPEHNHDGRYYTKEQSDERYTTGGDLTDLIPQLDNGWQQDPAAPVKYFKDHAGVVHIRGRLMQGSSGSSAFSLAAGYAPDQERTEMVWANNGASDIPGMIKIMPDGRVLPAHGSGGWISLDGISYKTAE